LLNSCWLACCRLAPGWIAAGWADDCAALLLNTTGWLLYLYLTAGASAPAAGWLLTAGLVLAEFMLAGMLLACSCLDCCWLGG